MKTITYLREGRKLRASGRVVSTAVGLTKVKPEREGWGHVWVTQKEIEAGREKPAYQPRPERAKSPSKKARKTHTQNPTPLWKQLVDRVRLFEIDHAPDGWPGVKMQFLTDMANELEAAHAKLSEYLPMTQSQQPKP